MFIAAICMRPFDAKKTKVAFHQFFMIGLSEFLLLCKSPFFAFFLLQ